jgi:hypothetical protein
MAEVTQDDIDTLVKNAASGRKSVKAADRATEWVDPMTQLQVAQELNRKVKARIKPSRLVLDKGF